MNQRLMSFEGKTVAVIGGTSGIGLALAQGFARQGATVFPASRTVDKVQAAVAAITEAGGIAHALTVDVLAEDSVQAFCDGVLAQVSRVDVLVNSAGAHARVPTTDMALSDWQRIIDINLTGTFLACRAFGKAMIAQGSGSIINIASVGSFVSLNEAAAYSASKGGVLLLTRALGREWAAQNVRVNALVPGFFLTDLNRHILTPESERRQLIEARTPMGRLGNVEELVGAALYLASDSAGFVTGTTLTIDGGFLATGL